MKTNPVIQPEETAVVGPGLLFTATTLLLGELLIVGTVWLLW